MRLLRNEKEPNGDRIILLLRKYSILKATIKFPLRYIHSSTFIFVILKIIIN